MQLPILIARRPGTLQPDLDHSVEIPAVWRQRVISVLVLEDDLDTVFTLSMILSLEDGFATEIVRDVTTCLARLRASMEGANPQPFDVLFLDVMLSKSHLGTEVLDAARGDPGLALPPVVVCTGFSPTYLARHTPELVASDIRVMYKPFNIDDLTAIVREVASVDDIAP